MPADKQFFLKPLRISVSLRQQAFFGVSCGSSVWEETVGWCHLFGAIFSFARFFGGSLNIRTLRFAATTWYISCSIVCRTSAINMGGAFAKQPLCGNCLAVSLSAQ